MSTTKLLQTEETDLQSQSVFKTGIFLPAYGTPVPKRVRDAPLLLVLIKIAHLVGVINGVL